MTNDYPMVKNPIPYGADEYIKPNGCDSIPYQFQSPLKRTRSLVLVTSCVARRRVTEDHFFEDNRN